MIRNVFLIPLLVLFINTLYAQSPVEKQNRVVYNRIEYFFNLQQADSIYNLSDDNFKKEINLNTFRNVIESFYPLGKIRNAAAVTFSNHIAGYNVSFANKTISLHLSVDSNYRFNYFLIQDQPIVLQKTETVQQKVSKTNNLDHFVDGLAQTYIKTANTQSLAIGIFNKGAINTFFYGQTNKSDKNSLPHENTVYEIGSISKVFTSILLADLAEKQIINLDDSIAKFLPDSVAKNPFLQKITFKQLANHTSGLPHLPANLKNAVNFSEANPYATYSNKDLYGFLKDFSTNREPGEEYEYSNLGFGLLGELISTITKKSYEQNIKSIITDSLGMMNTFQNISSKNKTLSVAKVYNEHGLEVPQWKFQALSAAGALKSTVNDMLRFIAYQFKRPESTLEYAMAQTKLFTFYLPPNTDIGLGWHMNMNNGLTQYWHNGGTGGSSSFVGILPDQKSAIVVLSNSAHSVDKISMKILEKMSEMN